MLTQAALVVVVLAAVHYLGALLGFSAVGVLLLYALLRIQDRLPLALGHQAVPPGLAFNTAVSFTTNTSWQPYAGESTLGHVAQMTELGTQAFLSAAVGLATGIRASLREPGAGLQRC